MAIFPKLSRANDYMWMVIIYFFLVFIMDEFVNAWREWYSDGSNSTIKLITIISFFLIFPSFEGAYNKSKISVHTFTSPILFIFQIVALFLRNDEFKLSSNQDQVNAYHQASANLIWMSGLN
mmetsp:Transcript_19028/g.16861  ORF Transcript_19028/g.16861 Transcript_19028/m.16861 type:complete len:122 (-) Transcript_19028:86-451(-)